MPRESSTGSGGVGVIGANIKRLRDAAGLTQIELAQRAGIADHLLISRWERGRHEPEARWLPRLAAALDCSLDELYGTGAAA